MVHLEIVINFFYKYFNIYYTYIIVAGNVCELMSMGYYDKVYCGASVPPEESEFLKSLINVQFLFTS